MSLGSVVNKNLFQWSTHWICQEIGTIKLCHLTIRTPIFGFSSPRSFLSMNLVCLPLFLCFSFPLRKNLLSPLNLYEPLFSQHTFQNKVQYIYLASSEYSLLDSFLSYHQIPLLISDVTILSLQSFTVLFCANCEQ